MRRHTDIVNIARDGDDPYRPAATPIYQTATFEQESALEFGKYDYTRSGNPTRAALESHIARLEGAARTFAFATGLAAITAVTRLLEPGDEILANDDLYGGTYRLFSKILARRGITVTYADLTKPENVALIGPRTKLVYCESLSNPLLRACDLRALAAAAHAKGAKLAVDATALSPYLQRPIELGADIVIHSATKYLCGHADTMAGVVSVADEALGKEIAFIQNAEGAGLAPFDSFLLLRGVKTLGIRVDRQLASTLSIARALASDPRLIRVHYPGLENHPTSDVHHAQADGDGAVVCFETGDAEASRRIAEGLELFSLGVSFGAVDSSVSLPCRMSHASIPPEVRRSREFPDDLVRLSIGIEDPRDLLADLQRAFGVALGERSTVGIEPAPRCAEVSR